MKASLLISLCVLLVVGSAALCQEIAREEFNAGRKALADEKYDEALAHFLKARDTDAQNPEVHIWLGMAYLALGRVDEAADSWEKALVLAPDNTSLKRRLERLKGTTTDLDSDIALLEILLEQRFYKTALSKGRELLNRPSPPAKRSLIELLIAETLCESGDNQKAVEHVLAWQSLHPKAEGSERARLVQGRALAGLGRYDEARKHYTFIISKHPGTESALRARFELARLLDKEGSARQAVEAYMKVLATDAAKKASHRWFVLDAREQVFAIVLNMANTKGIPSQPAALTPGHERALEIIIQAVGTGDDAPLAMYLLGLRTIAQRYTNAGAPSVAAVAVGKVLEAMSATSKYRPRIEMMLGNTHFARGSKIFEENLERTGLSAEEKAPNKGFAAAIEAYIRAAACPDMHDNAVAAMARIADFYQNKTLFSPAIIVCKRLLETSLKRPDDVKIKLAILHFRSEQKDIAELQKSFMQVPEKLGDSAKKALAIIKEVAGAREKSAAGRKALALATEIAHFYAEMKYYDVASEALDMLRENVPGATGPRMISPLADFVGFTQTEILKIEADREFIRLDATYGGIRKRKMTNLHGKVLEKYQEVVDMPGSDYVAAARKRMISIARMYQNKKAYDVAREIYLTIAGKNAKWDGHGMMKYLAARCLLLSADETFAQWSGNAKAGEKPSKISPEYKAAIEAYLALIRERPQALHVLPAYRDMRGIAITYAKAGAWDAASTVYGFFLAKELSYLYPEQVLFEQSLCDIGKVLPKHALEMLQLVAKEPLTVGERAGEFRGSPDEWGLYFKQAYGQAGGELYDEAIKRDRGIDELSIRRYELEKTLRELRHQRDVLGAMAERGDARLDRNLQGEMLVQLRRKEAEVARRLSQIELKTQQQQQEQQARQKLLRKNSADSNYNWEVIGDKIVRIPILTEKEIKRRLEAFEAAYEKLKAIMREHPGTPAARKARTEIMVAVSHLRSIHAYNHAAAMLEKFISDNPQDGALAQLELRVRMDYLAWARTAPDPKMDPMDRLAEIAKRFKAAREKLAAFAKAFPEEKDALKSARGALANSFLDEARLVSMLSPTRSRGRYVGAAEELLALGQGETGAPPASEVFNKVWQIAQELERKKFWAEAIDVYSMLVRRYPVMAQRGEAGLRIAGAYYGGLKDYLRAVEAYQEFLNANQNAKSAQIQAVILNIGRELREKGRWIEALHVYSVFVDSFPRHPQAGEALRAIGEIHQANGAWNQAITAYERVIEEYKKGKWTASARMSIATCYIQLSRWRKAIRAYQNYVRDYPGDPRSNEARRRIPILKDIERFQLLIDEARSPKVDDAQNQIAYIVETSLKDRIKAIAEYEKVVRNYPESHLADDALYATGLLYLAEGNLEKGRAALFSVANNYPTSPVADDAMYKLGQSYEREASQIEGITRKEANRRAREKAQHIAYNQALKNLAKQEMKLNEEIANLYSAGKGKEAEMAQARMGAKMKEERYAQAGAAAQQASRAEEAMTAFEMANRQDRINAALRSAVRAYEKGSKIILGDYADDALLRMAEIYQNRLKDPVKAMEVYDRIVATFPGTAVAENAVWRRAKHYEHQGLYKKARKEYETFITNYPQSKRVEEATFRLAEMYEHLKMWVEAIDIYRSYESKFPSGPRVQQARDRIIWIKTYCNLYE